LLIKKKHVQSIYLTPDYEKILLQSINYDLISQYIVTDIFKDLSYLFQSN